MSEWGCRIEEGTVYVEADGRRVEVGPIEDVYRQFGEEYEIAYRDWVKEQYDMSFADEGLVMDVAETVERMTVDECIVMHMKNQPVEADENPYFESARMPLFIGCLSNAFGRNPTLS